MPASLGPEPHWSTVMLRTQTLAAACLALSLAAPAALADVLVVAPSGAPFTSIAAAIPAAKTGDIVLVKSGSYAGLLLIKDRGVTIVADEGANVIVGGGLSINGLHASETVVLRGLTFTPGTTGYITNCVGPVRIEHCSFKGSQLQSPFAGIGVSITGSSQVDFAYCTITGGHGNVGTGPYPSLPGMTAFTSSQSNVSCWRCTVTGGYAGDSTPSTTMLYGGAGLAITGGTVVLDGCTITGGKGGKGAATSAGGEGGAGGDGLHVTSGGLVRHTDTIFAGGAGGDGGDGFF